MKRVCIIPAILIIFAITCSHINAGIPYSGDPKTIAHDFIDIEKYCGAGPGDYSLLNDLINKALVSVSYKVNSSTEDAVATLRQIDSLLKEQGYVFKPNYLLNTGIKKKILDCDNYCALYIAIAEVMKIPLVPVYAPNHSFIRFYFDDGTYLNWEPTQGMPQPDSYYIRELKISGTSVKKGVYLKSLNRQEFVAVEYNNIGSFLMHNRKYNEAVTYFSAAIELYPVFSSAYHNRGSACYAMNRREEALKDLLKANDLDPMRASTHITLGDIYLDMKEYEKAAAEFTTSIKLDPDDYVPYNNMAYIMKMLGNENESRIWFKKAQEIKLKHNSKSK